ncbi:hypothetical protein T310_8928, partial [Rasamsonia emersonii CBS 393.64]
RRTERGTEGEREGCIGAEDTGAEDSCRLLSISVIEDPAVRIVRGDRDPKLLAHCSSDGKGHQRVYSHGRQIVGCQELLNVDSELSRDERAQMRCLVGRFRVPDTGQGLGIIRLRSQNRLRRRRRVSATWTGQRGEVMLEIMNR